MKKKSILKKIDVLFCYRRIPEMMEQSNIKNKKKFHQRLLDLQLAIYELDEYLETVWQCKEKKLASFWKKIYKVLDYFPVKNKKKICADIHLYQKRELDMRRMKYPMKTSFNKIYRIKSCDVKLMRKLIYLADPKLNKWVKESCWNNFDLITEVNDDVEDIFEDMEIYNCNRFLIGMVINGKKKTFKEYKAFIDEIGDRNKNKLDKAKRNKAKSLVLNWTAEQAKATKKLLKSQMKKI